MSGAVTMGDGTIVRVPEIGEVTFGVALAARVERGRLERVREPDEMTELKLAYVNAVIFKYCPEG